jgi:hypothetical protein
MWRSKVAIPFAVVALGIGASAAPAVAQDDPSELWTM